LQNNNTFAARRKTCSIRSNP